MSDFQTSGYAEMLQAQREQHERTATRIWGKQGPSKANQQLAKLRDAQLREQRTAVGNEGVNARTEAAMQRRYAAKVADPNSAEHVAHERWQRMFGGR